MAQKPKTDARQADFFGAPPRPVAPDAHPSRQDKPNQSIKPPSPPQQNDTTWEQEGLDTLAARLSPAELTELVAGLPDAALAHLVIATVRQLRRRLTRSNWHVGKSRVPSPLERAARQLVAELGEQGGDDDI